MASANLCAFSPDHQHFALVSLAVDKHRLRVYSTTSNSPLAELTLHANVTAIEWTSTTLGTSSSPSKKKRKNSSASTEPPLISAVALGLTDGTILLFSPTHGKTVQTLSHTTGTVSVTGLSHCAEEKSGSAPQLFSVYSDNVIRLWNTSDSTILGSWKTSDRIPFTCIKVGPTSSDAEDPIYTVLVANTSIKLLSLQKPDISTQSPTSPQKTAPKVTFTGHASPISTMHWEEEHNRIFTMSTSDRLVYVWQVPETAEGRGDMVASIPLDSNALSIAFYAPNHLLTVVSSSGALSMVPVPSELVASGKQKVPSLLPRSTITCKGGAQDIVTSSVSSPGSIHVARLVNGVRPVISRVEYLNDSQAYIQDITLDDIPVATAQESELLRPKRYAEPDKQGVHTGNEIGLDQAADTQTTAEGDLDVEIAELSLGQRLTALTGQEQNPDSEDSDGEPSNSTKKQTQHSLSVVPASSLTRTLIQALHSSDTRLLETCLAHSNGELIMNTVKRLPPQLAEPLVKACVERLGRGPRAGEMKGGGGGASSQRGTTLIKWVKAVLTVHSGHLMTIPDLVPRLSGLHTTLTSRLALQQSLLSLSGRLEMVLSQIEMRSSNTPAPLVLNKAKSAKSAKPKKEVPRYIEGESGDEDNDDEMQVEEDDEGSVEDVELGGDSDEDEDDDDEEEEEDSDEEDEDSDEDPTMNGFIDDEAEEFSGDEEEEEDSD